MVASPSSDQNANFQIWTEDHGKHRTRFRPRAGMKPGMPRRAGPSLADEAPPVVVESSGRVVHFDHVVGERGANHRRRHLGGGHSPRRPFSRRLPTPATRGLGYFSLLVYTAHMTRTNIDIDDEACTEVMRRYRLSTKREAVNFRIAPRWRRSLSGSTRPEDFGDRAGTVNLDEMRSGRAR